MAYKIWLVCGLGMLALAACESSGDGDATGGEAGASGEAGSSGAAGKGGSANAGTSSGGSGNGGTANGGSSTAGRGGSAGSQAGESMGGAAAGAPGGDAGGGGDAGAGGEDGSDPGGPAVAYISHLQGRILMAALDPETGKPELLPSSPIEIEELVNGVVVSPNRKFAYVPTEGIHTYPIQVDGSLPEEPSSFVEVDEEGNSPLLSLALDPLGRFAYAVSPFSSTVYVFQVDATTGALTLSGDPLLVGPAPGHRQPAFLAPDPSGKFVYVTQLPDGAPTTDDGIRGYSVNQTTGELTELAGSPFSDEPIFGGVLTFRPDGKFLYSTGGGLSAFAVDADTGSLAVVAGSPFTEDVQSDPWAPNVAMDPQGKRLYVSNFIGTRNITGFVIDNVTGALQQLPGEPVKALTPYSIAMGPGGRFLYVGEDTSKLSVFSISRDDGALAPIEGSPFDFGGLEPDIAFVTLH